MIYLFNSIDFVLFFILVLIIYWILPKKLKNGFLLIASYLFYASWNWKFLLLILMSTLMNYLCGVGIYYSKGKHSRISYLLLAIITDLSLLVFFKYFNFFIESFNTLFKVIGFHLNLTTLRIILPLGISFYTFETISYVVDIYEKKFAPTENIIDFALFVAYFPKLISGPIERARNLIPKIQAEKYFKDINYKEGIYLFIYGLFKKIVIADSLAPLVNNTFSLSNPSGAQVLIAVYAFAIQLYCDFSGYIDMARGISNFFGINLSINFNIPYFAKSSSDFWSRWNITLSAWVKDYIYLPLGGKYSIFLGIFPLFIAWILMGLWHGASFNYIFWGMYWFVITIVYHFIRFTFEKVRFLIHENKSINIIKTFVSILVMFHITSYGWLIFRSRSLTQIITFTKALISGIDVTSLFSISYLYLYVIASFLITYEILQYCQNDSLFIYKKNFYYQLMFYATIFLIYVNIGAIHNPQFLYFQF